jgi:hypothetical protein
VHQQCQFLAGSLHSLPICLYTALRLHYASTSSQRCPCSLNVNKLASYCLFILQSLRQLLLKLFHACSMLITQVFHKTPPSLLLSCVVHQLSLINSRQYRRVLYYRTLAVHLQQHQLTQHMLTCARNHAVNHRPQLRHAELDVAVQQRIAYLINYTLYVSYKPNLKPKRSQSQYRIH